MYVLQYYSENMSNICVHGRANKNLIYKCIDMFLIECIIDELLVWVLVVVWKYKQIKSVTFSFPLAI
jgi:hypothetical protein